VLQIALHRALDRRAHLARRGFYVGTDTGSLDDTLLGETDLDREIGAKLNRIQLEEGLLTSCRRASAFTLELFYFEGLDLREISRKTEPALGKYAALLLPRIGAPA